MKPVKRVFACFVSLLILLQLPYFAKGQTDTSSISGKFDNYRQHVLHEKVFVHNDKPCYFAGEIIWFKIYIVDGTFHKPLDVSKVAYVELLDNTNKPALQAIIALKAGIGNGSFYLPVSVASGNYKIRAYTNWMKNFSPDYFFEKDITIVNTLTTPIQSTQKEKEQYDIQFFPEGGNLVRGVQSKIAFRAVNSGGNGINFSGTVVDENNIEVVRFKPQKSGIGNFQFTPVAGHNYKAIIKPAGKDSVVKEIPVIYEQGYVLSLSDNQDSTLTAKIQVISNSATPTNQIVFLFVHTRQMIKIAEKINLNNGHADFIIDKSSLGDGISHLTLFNSKQQPVCERLYFKWPRQKLALEVKQNTRLFSPGEKVNLEIHSRNADGVAEPADISIAVYKQDSLQSIDPCNIYNYLWLSSDLKGNIESPEYYFSNSGTEINVAMDNLMLTHGWRRFSWDDLLKNKTPVFEFIPEYEGHIINGKIADTRTNNPAGNILTYLTAPGIQFQLYNCLSDAKGKLSFFTRNFYKSGEISVQTGCGYDPFYKIEIYKPFSKSYSSKIFQPFNLSAKMQQEILEHSIGMQVQNIFAGKDLSRFTEPTTDSMAFFEKPDLKYSLDDYTRFGTMEEVIREYVSGAFLHKKKNKFYLQLSNNQQRESFDEEPLVLFDGIPVCDFNKIIEYDPLRIKTIEILNRKYYSGAIEYCGIISFRTYKGDYADLKLPQNTLVMDYEGLQKQRMFYSPVYELEKKGISRVPDFRNLLYWSPDTKTDMKGEAHLSFYTSDREGDFVIMVQGISANGDAGSQNATLSVIVHDSGLK